MGHLIQGKVNDRQLNETYHCSQRLFDLLAVGQNLSGASQPGPQATVRIDSGGEDRRWEVGPWCSPEHL